MIENNKFDIYTEKKFLHIISNFKYGDTNGGKLRNLRLQNNTTIKQLSRHTGVCSTTLMHLEQNKIKYPFYYWKLICEHFSTNHVEYLELYTMKEDSIQEKLIKIRALLGAKTWANVGEYLGYSEGFVLDLLNRYTPNAAHLKLINSTLEKYK